MKKYFQTAIILFLVSFLLASCGSEDSIVSIESTQTFNHSYTGDFFAWTGSGDTSHYFKFVRVNGLTGAVTDIGGSDFFPAMKYAPDGTLYGISDGLHIIDTANGSTDLIGDFLYEGSSPILMKGAAFSPDGTLYVLENHSPPRVFTVNLSNAAMTYVGTPTALLSGLEFALEGTLYGAFADLFILNSNNMNTISKIGSTGSFISKLTFGSEETLFGMDIYPSTHIYSLNQNSGLATPLVATGSTDLCSLVAEQSSPPIGLNVKAVESNGSSRPQSLETLLSKESAIRAAHSRL